MGDDEYWRSLGQFVEAFAVAELSLFRYMAHIAEMPEPIARIVAKSWHVGNMIEFVRHVWKVTPLPAQSDELTGVLNHFGEINALRNSVIHYISMVTPEGERISSNVDRSMPSKTAQEHRVSAQMLLGVTLDVLQVSMHLISVVMHPSASLAERADSVPALKEAWRYKSSSNLPA